MNNFIIWALAIYVLLNPWSLQLNFQTQFTHESCQAMQKIQNNAELSMIKIVEDYLTKQNIHKNGSKHKNRNKKVLDDKPDSLQGN